jgi:hypothetical protein
MREPFDPYQPRDENLIEIKILKQQGNKERLERQAKLRHHMIDHVLVGTLHRDMLMAELRQINHQLRELDPLRIGRIRAQLQEMKKYD